MWYVTDAEVSTKLYPAFCAGLADKTLSISPADVEVGVAEPLGGPKFEKAEANPIEG